jgi:hypothetical protein
MIAYICLSQLTPFVISCVCVCVCVCSFHILREPADLRTMKNRVDRISYLRDLQREHMLDLLGNSHKDDAIIVVDFDLYALPVSCL